MVKVAGALKKNSGVFGVDFQVELMDLSNERHTLVLDAKTRKPFDTVIRLVQDGDLKQFGDISNVYHPGVAGGTQSFVMLSKGDGGDRVEGGLQVTPGKYHNAKSLSVDGVDTAPRNMFSAEYRKLSKVGARLLEHAVQVSRRDGCEGRIHLFPRDKAAELFYESLRFDGQGLVKDRDKHYYLPKKSTDRFIERINQQISRD